MNAEYPENRQFKPWEHELDEALRRDRINRRWMAAYRGLAIVATIAISVIAYKL